MKKVGILTINDYLNYGNRLQNYAAQEVLKSLGCDVETVINATKYPDEYSHLSFSQKLIKAPFSVTLKKIEEKIKAKLPYAKKIKKYKDIRVINFKNFTKTYIKETDFSISRDNIPNDFASGYDYFVTGSDQVWNPNFRKGSSVDFLTFAPPHKRIALSPSFGISKVPEQYCESFGNWLSQMQGLSVREEAGAKIIKELTGRDAPVLIDPTLMLKKEDWLAVTKMPAAKPKQAYLLTYFLGGASPDWQDFIDTIAQEFNLQVVNLVNIDDVVAYTVAPDEFLGYINSAAVVCTDSFHSAIFSILFNRPFIVFDRINTGAGNVMNSRMDTLLRKFKLESRLSSSIKSSQQIFDINFDHIDDILVVERKKAFDYLQNALNS